LGESRGEGKKCSLEHGRRLPLPKKKEEGKKKGGGKEEEKKPSPRQSFLHSGSASLQSEKGKGGVETIRRLLLSITPFHT